MNKKDVVFLSVIIAHMLIGLPLVFLEIIEGWWITSSLMTTMVVLVSIKCNSSKFNKWLESPVKK